MAAGRTYTDKVPEKRDGVEVWAHQSAEFLSRGVPAPEKKRGSAPLVLLRGKSKTTPRGRTSHNRSLRGPLILLIVLKEACKLGGASRRAASDAVSLGGGGDDCLVAMCAIPTGVKAPCFLSSERAQV